MLFWMWTSKDLGIILVSPNIALYKCTQYNTIQYNTIQYNTIQYNTTQHVFCTVWVICIFLIIRHISLLCCSSLIACFKCSILHFQHCYHCCRLRQRQTLRHHRCHQLRSAGLASKCHLWHLRRTRFCQASKAYSLSPPFGGSSIASQLYSRYSKLTPTLGTRLQGLMTAGSGSEPIHICHR